MDKEKLELLERAALVLLADPDKKLEMKAFISGGNPEDFVNVDFDKPFCGTAACFAGWMPYLGIPELRPIPQDFYRGALNYMDYIGRIFGLYEGLPFSREWDWFFSTGWPNDKDKLLERVQLAKELGEVPTNIEVWDRLGFTDI